MTREPRRSRHSAALRQTSYAYRFAAGYAPFYAAINTALAELQLPLLSCRIGIDSGEAHVVTVGHSATTNHADIIGEVVNIATKVEKAAPRNGICFGEAVVLNMHTLWLKHVVHLEPPKKWQYKHVGTDEPYKKIHA